MAELLQAPATCDGDMAVVVSTNPKAMAAASAQLRFSTADDIALMVDAIHGGPYSTLQAWIEYLVGCGFELETPTHQVREGYREIEASQ